MKHFKHAILGSALSCCAFAADHIDSPIATADPAADLLDFYAFLHPNDPEEVILITTVNPFANNATQFSRAVQYVFRFENEPGLTAEVSCSFSPDQNVSCTAPGDRTVSGPVGQTNTNGDFRVYAGLREDPFFFDFEAFGETVASGAPAFTDPGTDFFAGLNVLGLVIGINREAVSPEPEGAKTHFNHKIWVAAERTEGSGIQGGITGSWINPDSAGQGFVIEVTNTPAAKAHLATQFLIYYFGYEAGQRTWLISGTSSFDGNSATVDMLRFTGDAFGADLDPSTVAGSSVGSMTFSFDDCDNGSVAFASTAEDLSDFTMPIARLSSIPTLDCNLFASGQIDRNGRAVINSALVSGGDRKDAYNAAADPTMWADLFAADIAAGLTFVDSLDGIEGNLLTGDVNTLTGLVVDDRLQIDMSIPTCNGYLALEAAALFGAQPSECGGRTLTADVVDATLGVAVNGLTAPIGDGVGANDVAFLNDFPFLAPPNP